jgi:alanine dehydrogenase
MRIGVPKEINEYEYRVGLTPESFREFAAAGHELSVETGAGAGINASDQAYLAAGATIVDTAAEIFAKSEMIVKVKEPQDSEWRKLRENQIVFAFLHLAANLAQTKGLLASGRTAVAYETVTGPDGQGLPLLAPMSEIAGRLAIEAAGVALRRQNGGRGILLGVSRGLLARVVCCGGVAGTQAARMAAGLGADVTIRPLAPAPAPARRIVPWAGQDKVCLGGGDRGCGLSADAVIGAVLILGAAAPKSSLNKC